MPLSSVLLIHAAATLFMTGLIWFVQIVHYPLFARVGLQEFPSYEQAHTRRTSFVVGPVMVLELLSALFLLVRIPGLTPTIGLVLLLLIWISTAALQVPQHSLLERAYCPTAYRKLVLSNWLRTAAWTLRSLLALSLLA